MVDGDCMGRAFPEAQMTSFAIHDLQMFPLTLADVRDNAVVVARAASWKWMERISRKACVEVGSIAATCKAPRTGKEIKECAILALHDQGHPASAGRCRPRGGPTAIRSTRVLEAEGGLMLFTRQDRRRRPPDHRGLPARHRARIEGLDAFRGHALRARLPERVRGGLARRRAAR